MPQKTPAIFEVLKVLRTLCNWRSQTLWSFDSLETQKPCIMMESHCADSPGYEDDFIGGTDFSKEECCSFPYPLLEEVD
ncbi:hypothetical protein VNI00_003718 [Paramarasmius palmivorus]|uniref:Uncharacterized protein n=1 Tax=Paramarasmius palmivorus TaxID=297713 RepID=A0AAW0DSA7_9AGAR